MVSQVSQHFWRPQNVGLPMIKLPIKVLARYLFFGFLPPYYVITSCFSFHPIDPLDNYFCELFVFCV